MTIEQEIEERTLVRLHNAGMPVDRIPVELSTRFLERFGEQLHSSLQKAFEELISNGWDAGANAVDVHVDAELRAKNAAMAVFDNGASMDLDGLRKLWQIAISPKEGRTREHGRPLVGKLGIGKLSTFALAKSLTYVCKANDGVVRRVTMNYGEIDSKSTDANRLINDLELEVFELDDKLLANLLTTVVGGEEIFRLINDPQECGWKRDSQGGGQEEFGGEPSKLDRDRSETWTLAVLSNLKPTGRKLKIGKLRRMLAAALPFGSEMTIRVNGERLKSPKQDAPLAKKWIVGPDLEIDELRVDGDESGNEPASSTSISVSSGSKPYPYIELPGIGRVTGMVKLFDDKISVGKSEKHGASNGFRVNVLGRVVNLKDPSFGEKNLSHAAWARFRMTVRADGLNKFLATNREQFRDCPELKVFRAFLRKTFGKARTTFDDHKRVTMPDGGDVLLKSLGLVTLNPLRNVVNETLRTAPAISGMFDDSGIVYRNEARLSWREDTGANICNAIEQARFAELDDECFAKFMIKDRSILVNSNHPFAVDHCSQAERELIRTVAMVDLLADAYALDIGMDPSQLKRLRAHRDRLMRFRTMESRRSAAAVAQVLQDAQIRGKDCSLLEAAVSDAMRLLDFDVQELDQAGEPDGIANAFALPTGSPTTRETPQSSLYSFTFEARSSRDGSSASGNIGLDAAAERRKRHNANYALVVAPGFQEGSLADMCAQEKVTPMTTGDLGKLLECTARHGTIPANKFRKVFERYRPHEVSSWVDNLPSELEIEKKLTIDVFTKALEKLKGMAPSSLSASLIAYVCQDKLNVFGVEDADVISLAKGLQAIVPDLVAVDGDRILVNASAAHVAEAISAQLEDLHERVQNVQ
ncbi:MAG: ATP-binding protein [Rhodobacteraceae bacterium]|nr:ATP-binding protein [Paracoccaceae bacterium]